MKVKLANYPGFRYSPSMILRTLETKLKALARQYPVVTVTGPRQSGKTTLCRAAFPDKAYVNLERPDVREFAINDARGFLASYADGAILDEIQRGKRQSKGLNARFLLFQAFNIKAVRQ